MCRRGTNSFKSRFFELNFEKLDCGGLSTSALTAAKLGAKRYFDANFSTDVTSPLEPHERTENLKRVEKVIDSCREGLNIRLQAACEDIFQTRLESSGVFVNNWVHDALRRLKLRRIFLLRDRFPKLTYKTSSTSHESATWDFLKPLLPLLMSDDNEIIYPDDYQGCSPTDFHDAYTELSTVINGNGIRDELYGKIPNPLDFFKKRAADNSLSRPSRLLAELAVRALVTPLSSVAAERAGSYLRKLGAGKDRNRMGERALSDNMFMWANSDYSDKLMLLARGRALQERELSTKRPQLNDDGASPADEAIIELQPEYNKHARQQLQRQEAAIGVSKSTGKLLPQPGLSEDQRSKKKEDTQKGFSALFGFSKTSSAPPQPSGGNVSPSTTMAINSNKDLPVQQQQLQQLPQQHVINIDDETSIRDRTSPSAAKTGRKRAKSSIVNYDESEEEEEEEEEAVKKSKKVKKTMLKNDDEDTGFRRRKK